MNVCSGLVLSGWENVASVVASGEASVCVLVLTCWRAAQWVTAAEGVYMEPQTHTDCTRDCNVEGLYLILLYFL
jgi:hypothetical protein